MLQPYCKSHVARAFSRAAPSYDQVATLQRQIGADLLTRLETLTLNPRQLVDIGCGTGLLTTQLQTRFLQAQCWGIDFADGMLRQAQQRSAAAIHWLCADADQMPITSGSIDLAVSNLMLQWSVDCRHTLREVRRILAANGIMAITTFGPDTLTELRQCWQAIDHQPHVHNFMSQTQLQDVLHECNLRSVHLETQTYRRYYPRALDLMHELKALGASNRSDNRSKSLLPPQKLQQVLTVYEKFRDHTGDLPATYEVFFVLVSR